MLGGGSDRGRREQGEDGHGAALHLHGAEWLGESGRSAAKEASSVPWEDDDDWTGEPPEGRHSRDRARPEFWRGQRAPQVIAAAVALGLIVLVIVLLAR